MRCRYGWIIITFFFALIPTGGCAKNMGNEVMSNYTEETIIYGAGRFVIDIPVFMQFSGNYVIQTFNIVEVAWAENNSNQRTILDWNNHRDSLARRNAPKWVSSAVIEEKTLPAIGKWCKLLFYYPDPIDTAYGAIDLLVDFGNIGVWFRTKNMKIAAKEIVYEISTNLARAYRPSTEQHGRVVVIPKKDSFYLRHGAIDLPFEYQERVGIGFTGHPIDSKLALGIETTVVHEIEKTGLIDRLGAVILSKYEPGLKVEKIRTRKRVVAGIKGEEVVYRGIEPKSDAALYFMWDFPGLPDSAHFPNIVIDMIAKNERLEEKLALWDNVLDSMRPAGR